MITRMMKWMMKIMMMIMRRKEDKDYDKIDKDNDVFFRG